MQLTTRQALDPTEIAKYPCVDNRVGSYATAVWDRETFSWFVHGHDSMQGAVIEAAHFRDNRWGDMYFYYCQRKDKWQLMGALDNSSPVTCSKATARGGRKKAS